MDVIINSDAASAPIGTAPIEHVGQYYHQLLACLGYNKNAPPVADLLRRYHGLKGQWLVASPIYWQASHNDAMIMACGTALQLSADESRLWFDALAAFLKNDPIKLHYHDANTWLIQPKEYIPIQSMPVHTLVQQSMMSPLQALDETFFWQRFITENQMFFSEHPLNQSRVGRYPINGLWIWGGGKLKAPGCVPIVYDEEVGARLANLLSTKACVYQPGQTYSKNTVLLLSTLQDFKRHTVRWYWNNLAYVSKGRRWWKGFLNWRKN